MSSSYQFLVAESDYQRLSVPSFATHRQAPILTLVGQTSRPAVCCQFSSRVIRYCLLWVIAFCQKVCATCQLRNQFEVTREVQGRILEDKLDVRKSTR